MGKKEMNSICEEHIFSTIYEKYSKDLYTYLYFKFGNQIEINDKIHDAFVQLWLNCKDIIPSKARAYLFRVGKNIVLNDLKHKKVILKFQQTPQKNHTHETPEFLLEEEEFMKKYQLALSKLTENQRVAFLLNKVKGKRPSEIATMLGVTQRTIENRIFVAFKKLKEEIKELNTK